MKLFRVLRIGVLGLALLAGGIYGLLCLGVWAFQDELLFWRRTTELTRQPDALGWNYEDVWVTAAGQRTHGWWIPAAHARGVVLFSHGSGRNVSHYLEAVAFFRDLDFSVLLYDYGGYGQSEGRPSEARCYADIRAMWEHLVQERGIAPECIVLVGSSMGGGVTADWAAEAPAGAVLLESTFLSVPDAAQDVYGWLPFRWLARVHFRNIDKVPRIQCPVLVIHSSDDAVVPFSHGKKLYDAVTAPKQFVEIRGGHSGGKFDSKDVYAAGLKEFFGQFFECPKQS